MSPSDETPGSGGNNISLRGPAWLRAGLTGLLWLATIGALGVGMVWIPKGEFSELAGKFMVLFLGVPLLIVSMVSTLIARALLRNSGGGIKAAVIFDVIVVVPLVVLLVALISGVFGRNIGSVERIWIGSMAATFALLSGVEAVWLLVARRGKKQA
jgi:hypothetical protein